MPYMAVLTAGTLLEISANAPATNVEGSGITVAIIRRDRISEIDAFTIQPNADITTDMTLQTGVARMIIFANPPLFGGLTVRVTQAARQFEQGFITDGQLVFDVA